MSKVEIVLLVIVAILTLWNVLGTLAFFTIRTSLNNLWREMERQQGREW